MLYLVSALVKQPQCVILFNPFWFGMHFAGLKALRKAQASQRVDPLLFEHQPLAGSDQQGDARRLIENINHGLEVFWLIQKLFKVIQYQQHALFTKVIEQAISRVALVGQNQP